MKESLFCNSPKLLYGIGAQKSGTTWIYDLLKGHPECHCSKIKEFHYFDVLYQKNERIHLTNREVRLQKILTKISNDTLPPKKHTLDLVDRLSDLIDMHSDSSNDHSRYLSMLMKEYSGEKVICDITPAYSTLDRIAFKEMNRIRPALFLFIMRDPVDRFWSQMRMTVDTSDNTKTADDFSTACMQRIRHLHWLGRLPKIPRSNYVRTMAELEAAVARD